MRSAITLIVLWLFSLARGALAHPLAPSLLELREDGAHSVRVLWKTPRLRALGADLQPQLPEACRPLSSPREESDEGSIKLSWTVDCGSGGIVGRRIGVGGLERSGTVAVVRLVLADGRRLQGILSAQQSWMEVSARRGWHDVAREFGVLGIHHIASGTDHLLFVFGLLLLATSFAAVAQTVSAFTLGHSVTLSLVVLGVIAAPSQWIEVAIALSVLLLAIELARDNAEPTLMRRSPWLMAAAFGLLHGLGFAAALTEAGLPNDEVPLALLSFNVGIELGQLAFVVVILACRGLVRDRLVSLPAWARWVPVYAMGVSASFWCFERVAALYAAA
jgi:hydrogenase/urease accessory protein HupE